MAQATSAFGIAQSSWYHEHIPRQRPMVWTQSGGSDMKQKITHWKESDGKYLGYLNDYPEHWTQGDNLEDLKEHLLDLYKEFSKNDLPGIKKVEEIEVG